MPRVLQVIDQDEFILGSMLLFEIDEFDAWKRAQNVEPLS